MLELILYSRSYCHLCDDMRDAVMQYQREAAFDLEIVDVDADPDLIAQYDELVPVLATRGADGRTRMLCHYFLDPSALRALLDEEKMKGLCP